MYSDIPDDLKALIEPVVDDHGFERQETDERPDVTVEDDPGVGREGCAGFCLVGVCVWWTKN